MFQKDSNIQWASGLLSLAVFTGCASREAPSGEIASEPPVSASTTTLPAASEVTVPVALISEPNREGLEALRAPAECEIIVEARLSNGDLLLRVSSLSEVSKGDGIDSLLQLHGHCLREREGRLSLIAGTAPETSILDLSSSVGNADVGGKLKEDVVLQVLQELKAYYDKAPLAAVTGQEIPKSGDPIKALVSQDSFYQNAKAIADKENSSTLNSRRPLTEKDSGLVVRKSPDGLSLYVEIGDIEAMTREVVLERRKSKSLIRSHEGEPPKLVMLPEGGRAYVYDPYLRVSESLQITEGQVRLLKSEASADRSGAVSFSTVPHIVRSASFPEFTAKVIASTEPGKAITNKQMLQKLRDFMCDEGNGADK